MGSFALVIVFSALLAFGGVPLALLLVGRRLPAEHVATRSVHVAAPRERVFDLLLDVRAAPRWRSDVTHVAVVAREPRLRYRERGRFGLVLFEVEEASRPERFVTRVVPERGDMAFSGRWLWTLAEDEGGGTHVTLVEEGAVRSPIHRALMRHLFGTASTLDRTLAGLARHLRR